MSHFENSGLFPFPHNDNINLGRIKNTKYSKDLEGDFKGDNFNRIKSVVFVTQSVSSI